MGAGYEAAELRADGLACERGGRLVFSGLSFGLASAEALVLRGPNGSGKTSLLRLIAGLLKPAAGRISWGGENVAGEPEAHRARLHYVAHQDAVKAALSVAENIAFWARYRGGREASAHALAHFGLNRLAAIPARYLSAGQRRRLALCRLIAISAPLWLLDEPHLTLDAEGQAALLAAIAEHRGRGGLVVMAAHGESGLADARTLELDRFAPAEAA